MKRAGTIVVSALAFCLLVAAPAFAGSELPPPQGPQVKGAVVHAGGGTAFTGANITLGVLLMAALLLAGMALLVASRRKAVVGR